MAKFCNIITLVIFSTMLMQKMEAANILSVFGYPGPSQYIYISPLLKALAEKGHEVTSINLFPQQKPLKNFKDIVIKENSKLYDDLMTGSAGGDSKSFFEVWLGLAHAGESMVTNLLENSEVQQLMKHEQFDLILVEIFFSEAVLGLGEHFKAPIIAVSTFCTVNFMDYLVGNPSPLSYIPHMALPYDHNMSLKERIMNVVIHALDNLSLNYLLLPYQERLYKKYFSTASLTFDEARRNISLVLLNDHFSLRATRPYVPNMIEVGGLHIQQNPPALPADLQQYLDNSPEGVIYFSLGSNVKSKDLPADKLAAILDSFRDLKLKVLWKFEKEELPNKPNNVLIRKWYPQSSVLAHPNVKLFISHGGFLSTTETIYYGKPVLGIPIIGDQFMNIKNAVKFGYALAVEFSKLNRESLTASISELWHNPKYSEAVQRVSKKFRDQPLSPLDTAIYWVEYVLRHNGAVHMRNAGQNLTFIEYHNIDVYLILSMALLLLIALVIGIFSLLLRLFCGSDHKSKESNKIKSKKN